MSTCRCCGQHIVAAAQTAPASQVVRVDDTVLAICNTAFEQARARTHAHAEIAHAVLAIAMSEEGARALTLHGMSAQQVGQAADAWLGKWAQMRNDGEALSTSPELKQVLRAAGSLAQRAGRTHASQEDFLVALSAQTDALWSASFWSAVSAQHKAMRSVSHEASNARGSVGLRETMQFASGDVTRGEAHRTVSFAVVVPQPSLLDREYAWLRDMKRTPVSVATGSARHAGASPGSQNSAATTTAANYGARASSEHGNAAVVSPNSASRLRGDMNRDAATATLGSERVTRLFATVPAALASDARVEPSSAPVREDQFTRSILQRLDTQERTLAQRLDTQQRMIAELAEAFARSMRELAQARSEAAAAVAHASAQDARTRTSASDRGEGLNGSSDGRCGLSRSPRSRSARGSWRRQSWSSWRRRQRRSESQSSSDRDGGRGARTWSQWPDRMRAPREERAPRQEYAPRDGVTPDRLTAAQFVAASAAGHEADESSEREKRFYLALDDHIEKAPSIGSRTAALLNAVGVMTVRDLLACDTPDIAARLHNRYITAERLAQWQAQSRLVCSVPWLRGTHAQLLAGAGFDTIEKIVAADAPSVCAAILKFAATRDGMSVLRSSPPPGEDWVIKRLEHARAAEPERAVA